MLQEGELIINEIIYAELVPQFPSRELLDNTLTALAIKTVPLDREAAYRAGLAWKEYKKRGSARARVLPDFLIGAQAYSSAQRLLTRDRGFYRQYFKSLKVIY